MHSYATGYAENDRDLVELLLGDIEPPKAI